MTTPGPECQNAGDDGGQVLHALPDGSSGERISLMLLNKQVGQPQARTGHIAAVMSQEPTIATIPGHEAKSRSVDRRGQNQGQEASREGFADSLRLPLLRFDDYARAGRKNDSRTQQPAVVFEELRQPD